MTIQEAARNILEEYGKPLTPRNIARIALERGLVGSRAQDPISSLAQTIEKHIREDIYNKPRLIFIHEPQGRLIGLPPRDGMASPFADSQNEKTEYVELKAKIPTDLFERLQLAVQAKLANNFDGLIVVLLKEGLSARAADIRNGVLHKLDQLGT